jgi:integrase
MARRAFGSIKEGRAKKGARTFQAFYRDPARRRSASGAPVRHYAPNTYSTQLDAEAWLASEKRLIDRGEWTSPEDRRRGALAAHASKLPTFADYAERWIERRRVKGRPLAERTKANNRDYLRRFLGPIFGDLHLDEITPGMVNDWYDELCPDHPTQRSKVYSFARAVMNTAVSVQGPMPGAGNPFGIRGAGSAEHRRRDEHVFTSGEIEAMLGRIRNDHRAMILLALWCGLRYGEIVALRRADIDIKKRTVKVRHSVAFPPSAEPVLKAPKSDAGNRDARIPAHVVPELKQLLGDRIGLLFPNGSGGYLRPSAFYGKPPIRKGKKFEPRGNGWYAALTAAGRWHDDETKRPHFHDLRATGATKVARLTNNVAEVQRWLGDSTPQAAMRYMRATDTAMDEIADGLSALAEGGDW